MSLGRNHYQMSEKKTVAATSGDNNSRIFGGWTDIIILAIAITPSALLYYEISKIKKQQVELCERVSKIEQIVFHKNERGDIVSLDKVIMGAFADRASNNATVEELKKDNARLIKQINTISKQLQDLEMFVNLTAPTSRNTDFSSSKRSNNARKVMYNKQMFIPQSDYEEEEDPANPEDDFINSINGEVV